MTLAFQNDVKSDDEWQHNGILTVINAATF